TPTPHIYTLSLHDALPIWSPERSRTGQCRTFTSRSVLARHFRLVLLDRLLEDPHDQGVQRGLVLLGPACELLVQDGRHPNLEMRSEEHTSELQSRSDLVCR